MILLQMGLVGNPHPLPSARVLGLLFEYLLFDDINQ